MQYIAIHLPSRLGQVFLPIRLDPREFTLIHDGWGEQQGVRMAR